MILPGGTIGILGGGQLGRMLILAGRPMGYRFHIFCPDAESTAGRIADTFTQAAYDDFDALERFARSVDCITFEFENIPSDSLNKLNEITPIHPKTHVLHTCQNRQREKDFLKSKQFPCAQFKYATCPESLKKAVETIGFPSVIKTAAFGYDGKGQIKLDSKDSISDPQSLWETLNYPDRVVVEEWIEHKGEYSVVCARNEKGEKASFPVSENVHIHHILHSSIAPALISKNIAEQAHTLAERLADTLEVVGLLAVEFFLTQDDQLIVNEMAPRPHNSGHYTIDACHTSQFHQHIRAITGLPLGKTDTHTPAVMINILGDLWPKTSPSWNILFENPSTQLHLYDKGEARKGRKMGHFTVLGQNLNVAKKKAEALFLELKD